MASHEYNDFFINKTIQKEYMFNVSFTYSINQRKQEPDPPKIQNYDVVSCEVPQWDFKKENQKHGSLSKTFPVLESDGLEFSIELSESDVGIVDKFVTWSQKQIIGQDGIYNKPSEVPMSEILLQVKQSDGSDILSYRFVKPYLLKSNAITYNYSSSGTVSRSLTFNCDYYETEYYT